VHEHSSNRLRNNKFSATHTAASMLLSSTYRDVVCIASEQTAELILSSSQIMLFLLRFDVHFNVCLHGVEANTKLSNKRQITTLSHCLYKVSSTRLSNSAQVCNQICSGHAYTSVSDCQCACSLQSLVRTKCKM
jgi:hypothetical protein